MSFNKEHTTAPPKGGSRKRSTNQVKDSSTRVPSTHFDEVDKNLTDPRAPQQILHSEHQVFKQTIKQTQKQKI